MTQPRRDQDSPEARPAQAKIWLVVASVWVVVATVFVFTGDLHPAARTLLALTGVGQAVAGVFWWRTLQKERSGDG